MIHIICSGAEWVVGVELEINLKYERALHGVIFNGKSEIVIQDQYN